MRHLARISLILLLFAPVVAAQYTTPTGGFDTYHGLAGTTCTHGTATAFSIATVTVSGHQNKVFCDFSGHIYWFKSFFTFDLNLPGGTDEFGHTYNFYALAKYGTGQAWADASIGRFLTWGYTGLMNGRNTTITNPWTTANPVPFLAGADIMHYSANNAQGYTVSCNPKDLAQILKKTTFSGQTSGNLIDLDSPCWGLWYTAYLNNDPAFSVKSQSTAMKHYLLAIDDCDADNCHGFGAGPDFVPANSNYDFRLGTMGLYVSPTEYADSSNTKVYFANPGAGASTVYIKKTLHDQWMAKYGTVGALNTAIGSSYTTDLTSGNCFGASQPNWLCVLPAPEVSIGTGNGVTTTFSGTLSGTVSKFSVYISVNTAVVGGDTGAGALYGNLSPAIASGTINYSTGAISVTFSTAPANGASIGVGYIQNGWGIGTGAMDEDCRAGHTYCPTSLVFLTGATASLQADINALTKTHAQNYASQATSAIATWAGANGFTGKVLHAGIYALGSWGAPPDKYVLQGLSAGGQDIIIASSSGNGFSQWSQAMLDYVQANWGDVPIIKTSYRTSNRDSEFDWRNTPTTGSGTTATATLVTPINFTTGGLIDTFCANPAFNRLQIHPSTVSSPTITWTTSGTVSGSTTCDVAWSDNNVGGFTSQVARATDYKNDNGVAPTVGYTASGVRPYIGVVSWAWQDYWNEQLNWGIVTARDNPINGIDNSGPATFACQPPDAAHTCGGEAASHAGPMGDYVDTVGLAHVQIDNYFLGSSGSPAVSLNPTSAAFGNSPQNTPDTSCNVTLIPCVITLTNSGSVTLNITSVAIVTGTNFSIANTTCGSTLTAGNSCAITVTFTPTTLGALSDTLRFTTNASTSPDNVSLTGTGVIPTAPAVQMSRFNGATILSGKVLIQ